MAGICLCISIFSMVIAGVYGEKECPADYCSEKPNGNYPYIDNNGQGDSHWFTQCVEKVAYCRECWPSALYYKAEYNQCLYELTDECLSTMVLPTDTAEETVNPSPTLDPNEWLCFPSFQNMCIKMNVAKYLGSLV